MIDSGRTYETVPTFCSLRVVESLAMTKTVEDWSRVRSPSRARRRMKRGFPQNLRLVEVPRDDAVLSGGVMYVHPVTMTKLRELVEKENHA